MASEIVVVYFGPSSCKRLPTLAGIGLVVRLCRSHHRQQLHANKTKGGGVWFNVFRRLLVTTLTYAPLVCFCGRYCMTSWPPIQSLHAVRAAHHPTLSGLVRGSKGPTWHDVTILMRWKRRIGLIGKLVLLGSSPSCIQQAIQCDSLSALSSTWLECMYTCCYRSIHAPTLQTTPGSQDSMYILCQISSIQYTHIASGAFSIDKHDFRPLLRTAPPISSCVLPHQAPLAVSSHPRTRVCVPHAWLVLRCSRTGSNLAPGTHRTLLLFDDSPPQLPGRIQLTAHSSLERTLGIPIPVM